MPFQFLVSVFFAFSFEIHLLKPPIVPGRKTEYPKNITALLHPNFKKSVRFLKVLKIRFRNSRKLFYQVKSPDNFISHLVPLFYEELLKVVLVKNYSSVLLFFVQDAKIRNVVRKCNYFLRPGQIVEQLSSRSLYYLFIHLNNYFFKIT